MGSWLNKTRNHNVVMTQMSQESNHSPLHQQGGRKVGRGAVANRQDAKLAKHKENLASSWRPWRLGGSRETLCDRPGEHIEQFCPLANGSLSREPMVERIIPLSVPLRLFSQGLLFGLVPLVSQHFCLGAPGASAFLPADLFPLLLRC